ncbi:MAG: hypothetical protein JWP13_139 [Candidatus Saccharibacteria bacterium]|nr:hypothetical protein [Candidatus Saccharibacteria bacterium]
MRRKLAAAGLVVLGGFGLTACGEDAPLDYAGTGNEFTIQGIVSDSEDDGLVQIKENEIEVIEASGKAEDWFNKKEGLAFLHDEFDFLQKYSEEPGGWFDCGEDVYVGEVYDKTGTEIEPEQLKPGDVIEIQGRIRQSIYYQSTGKSGYCNDQDLAVYDAITTIGGPLRR